MSDSNICKNGELDFFLIESCMFGDRDAVLGMGMDMYVLFHNDGVVEMVMTGMMPWVGKWEDGVMIFIIGDDEISVTRKYTIDGDVLTVIDEEGGTTDIYRRGDYDSYDKSASASPGGGSVVEVSVTDGFISGVMSMVCPDGWYGHKNPVKSDMIIFNTNPDSAFDGKSIYVEYGIKECVTLSEGQQLPDNEIEGKIWGGVVNGEGQIEVVTYIGGNAVKVTTAGLSGDEADMMAFGIILSTINLTWETEEGSLSVCEGKETDFFELRSMKTSGSVGNRSLLQQFGYDWCILFSNDGAVTAKFDRAVTCYWGDGFGSVVSGTWNDGIMTFINGDVTGVLEYALEGDRLTVVFNDGQPVVFQRSNAESPDFDALAKAK